VQEEVGDAGHVHRGVAAAEGPAAARHGLGDEVGQRDVAGDERELAGARPRVVALVIAETLPYVRAELVGPTSVRATFAPDHGPLALGASGTMRAFTRGGAFLFGGQLDVSHGRFLLGASVTGGAHDDPLGALHPWVLAGVASVDLLCGRHPVELCLAARVDAGYAFATAARGDPSTTSRNVDAPYLQLSGALRAALPAGRAGLSLDAVAGWAEGLVVTADQREAVRLAGPVVMVSVGARVWP